MNICVTGGAGFIGSHLTDRLIALGHKVIVIDNLMTGLKEYVNDQALFYEMDIRNSSLEDVFNRHEIEIVFHEAAQTMVPISMKDPQLDCDINLMGLLNVLEACRKTGVQKILVPSSAAVYGDCSSLPLSEDVEGVPSSFYGLTKLTTEKYLSLYYEHFQLPYICFRYANVYGPRQGNGGEGGVISIFCQLLSEDKEIHVYGDGLQTRDFIYVDDVVDANIAGIHEDIPVGIYNVSTEVETTINDLVLYLKEIAHKDIPVVYNEERGGDIRYSSLSVKKSSELLDWKYSHTIKEGLSKTYRYFAKK